MPSSRNKKSVDVNRKFFKVHYWIQTGGVYHGDPNTHKNMAILLAQSLNHSSSRRRISSNSSIYRCIWLLFSKESRFDISSGINRRNLSIHSSLRGISSLEDNNFRLISRPKFIKKCSKKKNIEEANILSKSIYLGCYINHTDYMDPASWAILAH